MKNPKKHQRQKVTFPISAKTRDRVKNAKDYIERTLFLPT